VEAGYEAKQKDSLLEQTNDAMEPIFEKYNERDSLVTTTTISTT